MAVETPSPSAPTGQSAGGARTIGRLWADAVGAGRESPAYLQETGDGWQPVTWSDADTAVEEIANGLLALGVGRGDVFAIIGRTALEWSLFDFALGRVGAISAPVYPSSSERETQYIVAHSESVGVFAEDAEQLDKVRDLRLDHHLAFGDLDSLRERGRSFAQERPGALAAAEAAVGEEDIFTYIYTSGTTGAPKGCMIRHRNYYEMCAISGRMQNFIADDTLLLFLPLAHNFGRLVHLLGPYLGFTIAYCRDPLRVSEALPAVRPTVFPSVPRIYEKVHTAVSGKFDEATGVRRKLIDWALGVGARASEVRQGGGELPRGLAFQHRLADRLVYSKVKERLGGQLRLAFSGGAPLAADIAQFFHTLDILILEGYGLTECTTACAVNRPDRFRFGTVGPIMPGAEVRIAEDGEILIKSPTVFAGYLKEPDATRAVLGEDGWLRSGDIGAIDDDGFLTITDRKKDILVTAGGKNVAPQNLENDLKRSRFVSQALVVGDRRPYVAALITLEETELRPWAEQRGIGGSLAELAEHPAVRELVQEAVDATNEGRSNYDQIKRFVILGRDFTAEADEITPTLKLRRRAVEEHFAADIEALYAAPREPAGAAGPAGDTTGG